MATLVTAVLPASDAQLQFQGPFISTSVNRKTTGIIPAGIFRGFAVTALGPIVTINADGGTGDSVAVCNTINASLVENYYNVTVRHSGNINMDFSSAASPTVIVLEARYDLTSPTPVEGLTEVRIKAISAIDVMPYHVVLATATAGPNPLIDLSTADVTGGPLVVPNQLSPLGSSGSIATLQKVDGNVIIASFAFAPIPGTTIAFTQTATGPALFWVNATVNGGFTPDTVMGVRIDGALDLPTTGSRIHTFVGGVAAFEVDGSGMAFVASLSAGPHTAQLVTHMIDGFVGSAIFANPSRPINFAVLHT